ncbi:MAG: 2-iminoacetate synthase ThiH [Planctomycetes bacterium]|nr:2-iminoacetate synthase ThiH [Planctomycetota bacterium]
MSFARELDAWPPERITALLDRAGPAEAERALGQEEPGPADLAALLSPAARPLLERMARRASAITRQHFGRTVTLYAPLYVSNVCGADCAYCGFSTAAGKGLRRRTLGPDEIARECDALAARGFRHVLLVSGDAPGQVTCGYLAEAVRIARARFPSVSIEVQALDGEEYRRLAGAGIEGVTLYMETYDRGVYAGVHRGGRKADFEGRLEALERAGMAGVRRLNAGALLGLAPWRIDGFRLGLHVRWLQRACWRSAVAVSFPRLRHVPEGFAIPCPVGDADLVQIMLALRLFLPEAGFTLSTREPAALRDRLVPLGVTLLSAGSVTRPGGYADAEEKVLAQFEVEDRRSPEEVARAIRRAGYDPVFKDFDRAFDAEPEIPGRERCGSS